MAEALVSFLIEYLGSMALDRVGEEMSLVKGVDEDVANLKTNLEDIQAVLEDAEQKQLTDAGVRRWLEKLKNASHHMDDVLDEWKTAILEYKIMKEEEAERNASSPNKKVCFPIPFSWFGFTKDKRLIMRRDIALQIKQLNEDLDRIAKDKEKYSLHIKRVVERSEQRQTTFLIDETKVHGRDKEKSLLISKLLCESSDAGRRLDIIPIVGMGGLGKTTLAQLAYNDETIKTHFDKRIWVCVSDPFEEIKIAKEITNGLGRALPDPCTLNTLVQCIHESIEGKRFLLILDDVWLEDYGRWETLQEALRNGATGSKILVTTRKQEVAIMMGAATRQISLAKLSEEHCWLIFSQLAFMERTTEECVQLENIGRKIACKSNGLPLVAKTLGNLMRFKKTKSQWEEILCSELWESSDVKVKEIFAPFLLSYYDLPPIEKRCFLYCSIFPKDTRIVKDELIEMWMSQGYLGNNMSAKKKGVTCFESLAMRSFFQDFIEDLSYGGITCKMHDMVHDFAQFLTGNEYIFMEVVGAEETVKAVDESTRHLTIHIGMGMDVDEAAITQTRFPNIRYNTKTLRTLFIKSDINGSLPDNILSFPHLTCLRTLNLSHCGVEKLPEGVGELKHLRYLDLSQNGRLAELPDSLFDLCNLQTLKLKNCLSLRRLSEKIRKLVNLRNLHINWSGLEGLPKGIGKLTGLQTLDMLVVPKDRESYFNLEDMKNLNYLPFDGFLCIVKCANLGSLEEAEKVNLKTISEHLSGLSLHFRGRKETEVQDDATILEGLQPHPNLKCLSILCYFGATVYPRWMMSLVNLNTLNLDYCSFVVVPPLGKLPSLERLRMMHMSVEKVGPELLGLTERDEENGATREDPSTSPTILFPKLKILILEENKKLKEWKGFATTINYHGLTIMPCLHYLDISHCPRLQALPDFLQTTPLQYLYITQSKILEDHCQNKGGKELLNISHVPNIKVNEKWVDGIWIQRDDGSSSDPSSGQERS